MSAQLLQDVAKECRRLYDSCADPNLYGGSLLDLVADNLPYPLVDLRRAIVAAGIAAVCNPRIRQQIATY